MCAFVLGQVSNKSGTRSLYNLYTHLRLQVWFLLFDTNVKFSINLTSHKRCYSCFDIIIFFYLFQVDLLKQANIKGVVIQGRGNAGQWVTSFGVLTSVNGHEFQYISRDDGTPIVRISTRSFYVSQKGFRLRLYPTVNATGSIPVSLWEINGSITPVRFPIWRPVILLHTCILIHSKKDKK